MSSTCDLQRAAIPLGAVCTAAARPVRTGTQRPLPVSLSAGRDGHARRKKVFLTEEKMAEEIATKLENYTSAPFDARFPNQNQTRNCWSNYVDYHRCQKALDAKGADTAVCEWYKKVYVSLCPVNWTEKWDEQREEGTFAGKI